jgi:hypothetical protein
MDVLRSSKGTAPPLDPAMYPKVKYWTKKAYKKAVKDTIGDTNALATAKRKRGRPKQNDNIDEEDHDDAKHPYIEDASGSPVSHDRLWQLGYKARQCWFTLRKRNMAPTSWKNAESDAFDYFISEVEHEIPELRFCEGHWKLDRWATLNYPSFFQNHVKDKDVDGNKTSAKPAKKAKKDPEHKIRTSPGPNQIPVDKTLDGLIRMDIDDNAGDVKVPAPQAEMGPDLPAQHKVVQEAAAASVVVQPAIAIPVPATILDPL